MIWINCITINWLEMEYIIRLNWIVLNWTAVNFFLSSVLRHFGFCCELDWYTTELN